MLSPHALEQARKTALATCEPGRFKVLTATEGGSEFADGARTFAQGTAFAGRLKRIEDQELSGLYADFHGDMFRLTSAEDVTFPPNARVLDTLDNQEYEVLGTAGAVKGSPIVWEAILGRVQ